jgi:general secretion pathway protein K
VSNQASTLRGAPPARQRGAALLTAMVIVTLIATLTVGMVWQQWRAVQVEAAERTQVQARWILDGALDWSRIMLGADSLDIDHLGEPWAVELKEARLSTFLAADKDNTDDGPEAFLSGSIRDAQSRFNLLNLVRDNQYQPTEEAALRRLCELAGVGNLVAQRLIDAMRQANPGLQTAGMQNGNTPPPNPVPVPAAAAPLIPQKVGQLSWLGLDERTVARLAPFLVILPRATELNLNTAPKEVIAAVVPGADLSGAQRLVQARVRAPLKKVDDALGLLGLRELGGAKLSVKSNYFEVEGSLRLEHLIVAQRSLVERTSAGARNVFIRRSERILGGNPAITLQQ